MNEDYVICSGAEECKKLKDAVHIILYDGEEIKQRPENCSGRHPHLFNHDECRGMACPFINKWVECKKVWMRIPEEAGL